MQPQVEAFFHEPTGTVSYLVVDPETLHCAIIDSVTDFDLASAATSTESADRLIHRVRERGLTVDWILETHVHADHLSAAPYLQAKLGGKTGLGSRIAEVQARFAPIFDAESDFATDGSQFEALFADDETFRIGTLTAHALHTPGHTPSCVTYLIGDSAFTGDTLFMPDFGTARTDFPGGDARTLYRSIQRLFRLPESTRIFVGHDYLTADRRQHAWETTVADQRRQNIHVGDGATEAGFVAARESRDKTLAVPELLLAAVQINMRAGRLPPAAANGVSYLKLPLNVFAAAD